MACGSAPESTPVYSKALPDQLHMSRSKRWLCSLPDVEPVNNRYVASWNSLDEQYFAMYGPGHDGKEVKMMEMIYTRR